MRSYLAAFILFLSGACACKQVFAQDYSFTYYNASNGLSSSEIISLAKDEQGFLWIGTAAGLSRYDGYTFANYQYAAGDHYLGTVNVIKPLADGNTWIGASSGLYCMQQNKLIKVSAEANSPQGVNDIIATQDGNLWLATENGPAFILKKDAEFSEAKKIAVEKYLLAGWPTKNSPIDKCRATLIKKGPDESIYIAQSKALYQFASNEFKLLYTAADKNDLVLSIFPITKNKIFFDCALEGMSKIENGVYSNISFEKLCTKNAKAIGDHFWYAGTMGIFCFYPAVESAPVFINTNDRGVIWPSNFVKDGNILWLATHDGLIKLKPALFNTYEDEKYDKQREVYSFLQLNNGTFLAGGNRGRLWKKNSTGFSNYLPAAQTMVTRAEMRSLYEDERGWLWAGSGYQGLSVYRNGKIDHFTKEENGLNDNTIHYLFKTSQGKLMAIGDQGLTEITIENTAAILFKKYYCQPNISKHAQFYSGIEAPDGKIWIGGQEGLMFLQNDSLHSFNLFKKTVPVNNLKMAADGTAWIATASEGILHCRFDSAGKLKLVKQYNETDGLNTVFFIDLLIDRAQNIWAGSAKGLSYIGRNGKYKDRVLNFDMADGFIKPGYNNIKLYQDASGIIWAGTTQGIASFNPEELFLSNDRPAIYITKVECLKTNTSPEQGPLSLPYNNNSLSFFYTAIDFANQAAVLYFYKLDGIDSGWQHAGNTRTVSYQNLATGNYTFRVKALNDKGLWSRQEAVFAFKIAAPFWKTWWFRLLSLLLITAVVIAFIKRREKNAARREAEKTAIEKLKATSYQYQLEIEQVINFFVTSINKQNSIDEMLWDVSKNCISKLGFEDCVIYLIDDKRNVLIQKAAWGPKTTDEDRIVNPIEIALGKGIVGDVAMNGKAEIINDTSKDHRYIVDDASRLSEIAVPIMDDQKIIGIIDSEHSQKNFYTDRHLTIITTIASLLADKIDKMKAEQQTREKEIEVLKLHKDLATWQITALRAQMNPHFIFNAMNSIQQFTLKNDSGNANLYISKFSTLLRKVLHTSQQNNISLEEEMEQLQLYLDIEQLRMGKNFTYSITADEEIETDALKLPGMLVQPFVENAVKHGLPLKEGEQKLTIHFGMPDEHHLHAVITDNGIGRQRSAELQAQQKLIPHISKGIQLVKERLQLMEQYKEHHSAIFINDLPGHSGTQVSVVIPV